MLHYNGPEIIKYALMNNNRSWKCYNIEIHSSGIYELVLEL